ncbi:MAG: CHAT domain-containing protein, partial [Pseudonocardiaceae bacterium]
ADIRKLDGFEHFLAPPRWVDLVPAASDGAVVLINVSPHRADAILLRSGTTAPVAVELDHLTLADVRSHAVNLLRACAVGGEGSPDLEQVIPDVLAWLWDTVAEPVLIALGHTRPPSPTEPWPRLWWVPTGLLGIFPLHAAGLPAGESTLDRVISSYTPTIRALVQTRRRCVGARRHLTVAMQHTPGQADLPGAVAEAAVLNAHYPDAVMLTNHEATTDRVLAALPDATWAHFACHAVNNTPAPSRSGLLVHDRSLPLPDIARLEVQDAELAYLSACSTAQTSLRIPDEAIHLASAFQLAGYRHVIATLWPLHDTLAAYAAQRFYQLLSDTPDAGPSATILHRLTRELRDQYPDQPSLWAPLIHSGP